MRSEILASKDKIPGPFPHSLSSYSWGYETTILTSRFKGVLEMHMGPPLKLTAERAQGYSLALVAILDKAETLPIYTDHPEHVK
jgi:hypothetical protein